MRPLYRETSLHISVLAQKSGQWSITVFKTLQTHALTPVQEETEQQQQINWYNQPGVERRNVLVSLVRDDTEAFRDLIWRR
jgi:hypothetical protein